MAPSSNLLSIVVATTSVGQFVLNYVRARGSAESSGPIRVFERKAVEYGLPLVGVATCIAGLWMLMASPLPMTRADVLGIALLCAAIALQLALFMIGRNQRLLARLANNQLRIAQEMLCEACTKPGLGTPGQKAA